MFAKIAASDFHQKESIVHPSLEVSAVGLLGRNISLQAMLSSSVGQQLPSLHIYSARAGPELEPSALGAMTWWLPSGG